MDKIIAFFKSKVTKVIAWIVVAVGIVVLLLGGASSGDIQNEVILVDAIVLAVSALVAFISSMVKK